MASDRIVPVVLSGGSGTRLWPLSREAYPKQFLCLNGGQTLLQQTALRVADASSFAPLVVIANAEHRFIIAEQLRVIGVMNPSIILEPCGRNTGPAAVIAALAAAKNDPDALILLMPADHAVNDAEAFHAAVRTGRPAAEAGKIVLFGIPAARPEAGYGYICPGSAEDGIPGVLGIARFEEKPDRATAERYCNEGFLWNSGIFLFSARRILAEFERYQPGLVKLMGAALAEAKRDQDFLRLAAEPFSQAPAVAIDRAVMERTEHGVVVPADMGWTDVGAWSALWEIAAKDSFGNVSLGDVHAERATECYLRSEGPAIAAIGIDDLVVVASHDAVLVAGKSAHQDLSAVVARLRAARHPAA